MQRQIILLTRNALTAKHAPMLDRLSIPIKEDLKTVEDILCNELVCGMDTVDSVVRYVFENGGKRIRPALFLLTSRVAGANGKKINDIAAAIEMLHTASLLHDDVVDDALIRRGKPSAKAKWGNQISVLVGDLLLCRASRILTNFGDQKLLLAAQDAINATTEGELLEIAHQNDVHVNETLYKKIINGKTATLFGFAARAGAIVAKLDEPFENALYKFGLCVGESFQLADDALDYVADEDLFGKHAGTDLKEGKLTYPLIIALEKATEDERNTIRNALISGKSSVENLKKITTIIENYGGIRSTWQLARDVSEEAKRCLDIFKPSIERDSLFMLADYTVDRKE